MTVVDIASWREKQKKPKADQDLHDDKHVNKSDIALAADYVMSEWTRANRVGKLNQYFADAMGLDHADGDIVNDLNALAKIELDNAIELAIFHPGTSPIVENINGYSAILRIHDHAVSTPLMLSEAYARAFAILFYRELELGGVL